MEKERIGSFELLHEIGTGGMATVYRARQTTLDRLVAVKILDKRYARSSAAVGRFEQEAKALARLNHPNIVQVYEYGSDEGRYFIACELVEGVSLRELLESGPIPEGKMLEIVRQVALGLATAHEAGITHRDVKPANLLINAAGVVKVADFGIARLKEGPRYTGFAQSPGTPEYMSPEQCMGVGVAAASDLYSLGVVTYEMLVGKPPFAAAAAVAVAQKHMNEPVPLLPLDERASPDVARIVVKLLAKRPEKRFSSARELLDALEALKDRAESAGQTGAIVEPAEGPAASATADTANLPTNQRTSQAAGSSPRAAAGRKGADRRKSAAKRKRRAKKPRLQPTAKAAVSAAAIVLAVLVVWLAAGALRNVPANIVKSTPTGRMSAAREDFAAVILADGGVLVTGGQSRRGDALASAEVFAPLSSVFQPVGSMKTARYNHTATALADGAVLVVGGQNDAAAALRDVELFRPTEGAFEAVASLHVARRRHRATALAGGDVLVTGGCLDPDTGETVPELYDASLKAFKLLDWVGPLARKDHTATLLGDGRVLVAGGTGDEKAALDTAVILDVTGERVVAIAARMVTARYDHCACLLGDGRVLITGGFGLGGRKLADAEVFDPRQHSFVALPEMKLARGYHTSTLLEDGRVLVVGGNIQTAHDAVAEIELFDPKQRPGAFRLGGRLAVNRTNHVATRTGRGRVLVCGGYGGNPPRSLGDAEVLLAK